MLDALEADGAQSKSLEALDDLLRDYVNPGNVHAPLYAQVQHTPGAQPCVSINSPSLIICGTQLLFFALLPRHYHNSRESAWRTPACISGLQHRD